MGTDAQFPNDVHHHYQPISLIRSAKTREERRVALARPAPPLLSWAEAPRPVEELGPPEYLAVVENPPPVAESLLHVVELLLALTSGGKLSFCKRWLREATQDQIVCFLNIGGYFRVTKTLSACQHCCPESFCKNPESFCNKVNIAPFSSYPYQNCLDNAETVRTTPKLSGQSRNHLDNPETIWTL